MPDVLLNNDDVTVLGPPNTVEVLVDIGPTGTRGSKVFVGSGEPNNFTSSGVIFGQELVLNDLYINTSPGANYAYMYQYLAQPGGNTWVEILSLNPAIYSKLHTTTYVDGEASITIPISDIVTVSGSPLTANNFVVQYSIAHTHAVASTISIPPLVGAGTNLVLNFKAVEYHPESGPTEWIDLDEEVTTHLFISIVAGDEES
jgi:hypothetical protein